MFTLSVPEMNSAGFSTSKAESPQEPVRRTAKSSSVSAFVS